MDRIPVRTAAMTLALLSLVACGFVSDAVVAERPSEQATPARNARCQRAPASAASETSREFAGLRRPAAGGARWQRALRPPASASPAPANVVLVMADDLGAEWLSCYNPAAAPTPHLDALAAGGTRFGRCFSQPLCTPSRVTLMTGRYNFRNYVEFGLLPPTEPTIGDRFRDAGFRTGVFGKWQLSGDGPDRPDRVDPDDWGFDAHLLWQLSRRPGHGDKGARYWRPTLETGGKIRVGAADEYGPDRFVDALLAFATASVGEGPVGEGNDARPFLAYYPMALTHDPFLPTPESGPPAVRANGKPAKSDPDRFAESVRYADRLVGRIVAGLEAAGLREHTVVIFCGDNGTHPRVVCPTPHGPYRGGKGQLNDRGTWVPLIVSQPGRVAAGATDDRPVDFTDLLPTACTLAGVPVPADADGTSLFTPAGAPAADRREAAFIWYDPRHNARIDREAGAAVRDGRYWLYADGRFVEAGDPLDPAAVDLTDPLNAQQRSARDRLAALLADYAAAGGAAP